MGYKVVQVDLRGSNRGLIVSKRGQRVPKMVKAGFKVVQGGINGFTGVHGDLNGVKWDMAARYFKSILLVNFYSLET